MPTAKIREQINSHGIGWDGKVDLKLIMWEK
jgi:hypothetical protein